MKYTPNYELRKPDETDVVDVQDLNYNADIIDLELKALDDKLVETADVIDQELEALDDKITSHLTDNVRHITAAERATWNGKQDALGYTPVNKSGDTMTGILTAYSNTSYTVRQVRNIILSNQDANLSAMQNGDIWIKYK